LAKDLLADGWKLVDDSGPFVFTKPLPDEIIDLMIQASDRGWLPWTIKKVDSGKTQTQFLRTANTS